MNALLKDNSSARIKGAATSKRLDKMSNQVVNDLQSQIELL